jgi:Terminase large subunit, T4likevirus-type, N-terminal
VLEPQQNVSLSHDLARAMDICLFARDCGLDPDDVQTRLLTSTSNRLLVNCCRQWGKSSLTAILALHAALYNAPAMIVIVSPSMQQSVELYKKISDYLAKIPGAPRATLQSLTRMQLENGSRIISLPGSEKTVRGYSGATVVVVDEASRVEDEMMAAVRPMLATTNGRFIALSTPSGKRGWWYEAWTKGTDWERFRVTADECPRISKQHLASEKDDLGPLFAQEYLCEFLDNSSSVFSTALIAAALDDSFEPFITI